MVFIFRPDFLLRIRIMCAERDVLHHCDKGFVVYCRNCRRFQFAFGNFLCVLREDEFMKFCSWIDHEFVHAVSCDEPDQKSICLPTPVNEWHLVFSQNEIAELNDLLIQSRLVFEAKILSGMID